MNRSEFWKALEKVFGPALGHSIAQDLYLPRVGNTATAALAEGVPPMEVWKALAEETEMDEAARWVHRRPAKRNS